MRKLLTIAWRELYTRATDRTVMLIMVLAPVGIASIVGLVFGGFGGGSSPIEHIPVLVVNLDGGTQTAAFGDEMTRLLTGAQPEALDSNALQDCPAEASTLESTGTSLGDLIDGREFDLAAAESLIESGEIDLPPGEAAGEALLLGSARAAIDRGLYTALVIVPEDFSQSLLEVGQVGETIEPVEVEIYANQGRGIAAGIVRSVVDSITSQMASGTIAIGASMEQLLSNHPEELAAMQSADLGQVFGCAFMPSADLIDLDRQSVNADEDENPALGVLVAVGSAQGMFFALFTGQYGILSVYEDKKNWTLQRLVSTPTPRWAILGGKFVGIMMMVVFQLAVLGLALSLVGSLMAGRLTLIWGNDLGLLGLLLFAVAAAVGGLSMLVAGFMRSIEQANIFVTIINMAMAVLGGAFGFAMPDAVGRLSLIHWGRQAFELVAAGQPDIGLHLAALYGQGALLFAIGLIMFNRRFEV